MSKNTVSGAILALGACAALAVVVAAGAAGAQNNTNANSGGSNSNRSNGSTKMTSDVKFADEAAVGGLAEVQLGQLAAQKGASDEVRQFGQRMVDDHSKANQDLMQVASGKGLSLPTTLDAKHQAEVTRLSGLSGDKFDKAYVDLMLKDHKKDVGDFQKESTNGADPDIKSFATRTLPTLQDHLQMIQRIHDKMTLRKSGNLSNTNTSGTSSNSNMGNMNMGSNSNTGNTNSNSGKGKKNKNSNSNAGNSNSNMP